MRISAESVLIYCPLIAVLAVITVTGNDLHKRLLAFSEVCPAAVILESGDLDLGLFKASRLSSVGFDILFIATQERHNPIREENELLARFRNLSLRGKASMFSTLDALEKLAPNLSQKIRDTLNSVRK